MKIKLSKKQIESILADPDKAQEAGVKSNDPWWIIVLKVVKYLCEILLAGGAAFLAVSCAKAVGIV